MDAKEAAEKWVARFISVVSYSLVYPRPMHGMER